MTYSHQALTLPLVRWPGTFFGAVGPFRATSFHILLAVGANIVSDRVYPISHSQMSPFQ